MSWMGFCLDTLNGIVQGFRGQLGTGRPAKNGQFLMLTMSKSDHLGRLDLFHCELHQVPLKVGLGWVGLEGPVVPNLMYDWSPVSPVDLRGERSPTRRRPLLRRQGRGASL